METKRVEHEFGAFFDENSKVLILGTIPSPKSREQGVLLRTSEKQILDGAGGHFKRRIAENHR